MTSSGEVPNLTVQTTNPMMTWEFGVACKSSTLVPSSSRKPRFLCLMLTRNQKREAMRERIGSDTCQQDLVTSLSKHRN
eukprot:2867782-Amphidinium_carterae.1